MLCFQLYCKTSLAQSILYFFSKLESDEGCLAVTVLQLRGFMPNKIARQIKSFQGNTSRHITFYDS